MNDLFVRPHPHPFFLKSLFKLKRMGNFKSSINLGKTAQNGILFNFFSLIKKILSRRIQSLKRNIIPMA